MAADRWRSREYCDRRHDARSCGACGASLYEDCRFLPPKSVVMGVDDWLALRAEVDRLRELVAGHGKAALFSGTLTHRVVLGGTMWVDGVRQTLLGEPLDDEFDGDVSAVFSGPVEPLATVEPADHREPGEES